MVEKLSPAAAEAVWDFLNSAQDCETLEALNARLLRAISHFGLTGGQVVRLSSDGRISAPRPIFGAYVRSDPDQLEAELAVWSQHYLDEAYALVDPVIPMAFQAKGPFTWSEAEARGMHRKTRTLFGEARDALIAEAIVCPVRTANGDFAVVTFGMDRLRPVDLVERASIHALASLYAVLGDALAEPEPSLEPPPARPLTRRELECVYWVSVGKSDREIGLILGISGETVHRHVEAAKTKLGAASRAQLALRAFALGLIAPAMF